jgi:hypothetical protein
MNIVGKILVILNLVFAGLAGFFLAADFATRTNWKKYADGIKVELDVAQANTRAMSATNQELMKQVKLAEVKLDEEKQARKNDQIVKEVEVNDAKSKQGEGEMKAKEADLTAQTALAETNRLKEEVKGLIETIKKRDQANLDLQKDNTELRAQAVANENMAKATLVRNQNLLDQLMEARKKLLDMEQGTTSGGAPDPNRPNPPSVYVKGTVKKVDPDGLVQISLGSDQGIKVNHTLEVYRLKPQADYLGLIRIVDVKHHEAVGRMVRGSSAATRGPVRVGDQVSSTLGRQ